MATNHDKWKANDCQPFGRTGSSSMVLSFLLCLFMFGKVCECYKTGRICVRGRDGTCEHILTVSEQSMFPPEFCLMLLCPLAYDLSLLDFYTIRMVHLGLEKTTSQSLPGHFLRFSRRFSKMRVASLTVSCQFSLSFGTCTVLPQFVFIARCRAKNL